MQETFERYLLKLRETPVDEQTEHTGRSALEGLLNAFAVGTGVKGITVQHEPPRTDDKGSPDFRVKRQGMILGYVEVKTIGENLDKVLKSDQIKKYLQLSDNILVTDYLRFIWIGAKGIKGDAFVARPGDLEGKKLHVDPARTEETGKLIAAFFSQAPQGIARAQELAQALAVRSKLLRDFLGTELVRQQEQHQQGRLYALFDVFRSQVFSALSVKEFADAFAQTLAYGLFLARLNAGDKETVTLDNVRSHIPGSFRLIRELVSFLEQMQEDEYQKVRWVVDEVLSIVNGFEIAAVREDLSFRGRKAISRKVKAKDEDEHRLFERDPFIYFYEDYLKAYDPGVKERRGVYYTPPPVVNFIVRAVDDILKDTFGIPTGMADHNKVTVLDFACGTGTFLLEAFERIFENTGGADSGIADLVVREHLTKNLFGFEYLIAPYTIAHLKLSQYLKDKGHPLQENERLQVFLTNTLEPIAPQDNWLLPGIAAEVKAAQAVKDKPILVILGNPPYSGHSENNSPYAKATIDAYKKVDGKPLGEKNSKWLQDDYVKFIRFAQMKMEDVEEGIVGVITNHSWLDNPTFRGMRQSLLKSFDQIYVLDLHGSTKPKEAVPDGLKNENIFDIQKGVAITLLVKKPGIEKGIWFSEFWGSRIEKYRACAESDLRKIDWRATECFAPYHMSRPLDWTGWDAYKTGWQIADSLNPEGSNSQIFDVNVLGFQTHRDHFAIAFTEKEMTARLHDLGDAGISDAEIADKYEPGSNRSWIIKARGVAIAGKMKSPSVVSYRPFDDRWAEYSTATMDRPRRELLDHVAGRDNLQLLVPRQIGTSSWRHVLTTSFPPNDCVVSDMTREANYVFPIWRYDADNLRTENLSPAFRTFLDSRYDHHYLPEEIFGYIYAVLHAPIYRNRYAEFLRIDFPRIPFAETRAGFDALAKPGWELVQAHLLRKVPRRDLARYHGKGDHRVEAIRYSPAEAAIWINKDQRFAPLPQEVWDFHIGGYRVIDKYLKSRKGRVLSLDEITHVGKIADALAFTIDQMALIDLAYKAAFPGKI